jgi:hypothetical protein
LSHAKAILGLLTLGHQGEHAGVRGILPGQQTKGGRPLIHTLWLRHGISRQIEEVWAISKPQAWLVVRLLDCRQWHLRILQLNNDKTQSYVMENSVMKESRRTNCIRSQERIIIRYAGIRVEHTIPWQVWVESAFATRSEVIP